LRHTHRDALVGDEARIVSALALEPPAAPTATLRIEALAAEPWQNRSACAASTKQKTLTGVVIRYR
jgi:hypothetical protein